MNIIHVPELSRGINPFIHDWPSGKAGSTCIQVLTNRNLLLSCLSQYIPREAGLLKPQVPVTISAHILALFTDH